MKLQLFVPALLVSLVSGKRLAAGRNRRRRTASAANNNKEISTAADHKDKARELADERDLQLDAKIIGGTAVRSKCCD